MNVKKAGLCFLITAVMIVGMIPMTALTAFAANEAVYYQYSAKSLTGSGIFGASAEVTDYKVIDSDHKRTSWNSGWYVVRGKVTIQGQVEVDGPVHLILTDGCELKCEKGILVQTSTASLTIYAQSSGDNMGSLFATGEENSAAIGTDTGILYTNACGPITIHGGKIWAEGGKGAAGIGGGTFTNGGKVTIYGGDVYAATEEGGAGIGGGGPEFFEYTTDGKEIIIGSGGDGGEFTIYGGYVHAAGSRYGAGIGGGMKGNGGKVNLYGGKILTSSAHGGNFGRGFGGDDDGTITVGEGLALFDHHNERINSGFDTQPWENFLCEGYDLEILVTPSLNPEPYRAYNLKNGTVETMQCSGYTFMTRNIKTWSDGWYVVDDSGTFTDPVTVTGDANLIIKDGKTLTALGGIRVEDGACLNVYTQSGGESQGKLIVSAPANTAGIGGGSGKNGGAFTVHGGDITVNGGTNAAAIGGGQNGSGGTFSIYGGKVTAKAGSGASRAVGAGKGRSENGNIVVRSGYELMDLTTGQHISRSAGESWAAKLTDAEISFSLTPAKIPEQEAVAYRYYNDDRELTEANCTKYRFLDESEPLLLDGWYVARGQLNFSSLSAIGEVHLILLDGCEVTVTQGFHVNEGNSLSIYDQPGESGKKGKLNSSIKNNKRNYHAAGIGGDKEKNSGNITIHGGTIIAEGGNNAAGIGGGEKGRGGNITIYNGSITATGAISAAGIGGGSNSGCGNITINNGNIAARASYTGAGIGSAENGSGGTVTINGGTVTAGSTTWGAGIGIGTGGSNVDVTITGGTVTATGGDDGLISGDCAGINARNLTVSGGKIDAVNGVDYDAVVADKVTVTPKDTMCILVKEEHKADLNGSPFETETDITKALSGHNKIYFDETEHDHDYTGAYRDNGNGTHSQKCTKCSKYGPPAAHIYKNYKCACGAVKSHTHDFSGEYRNNGDGTHSQKCTKCDEWGKTNAHAFTSSKCVCGLCNHEKYKNTHNWEDNNSRCTVTRTCDICGEMILIEHTENIRTVEELPGKDCQTMGTKRLSAAFDLAEPGEITINTTYGPHPDEDKNGWCDLCDHFLHRDDIDCHSVYDDYPTLQTGKWLLNWDVTFTDALEITGDAVLYLSDNCTLTAGKGIILTEGNSLTIYAQSSGENMGKLIANGEKGAAGIGGNFDTSDAGKLVIFGGNITANGGSGAAGIGGGFDGKGGNVAIHGGTVTAMGSKTSGIGAGQNNENHGTLTLGKGITFGAGYDAVHITVNGDHLSVSDALGHSYFVTPYTDEDPDALVGGKICTVTFNMGGHGEQVADQTVNKGEKAKKPADPAENKYNFEGWYADAACSIEYDFNAPITADTTVYAKWAKSFVKPPDPTCPQTGDNNPLLLWIALLFVSGGTLAQAMICGRKKGAGSD